jgi:HSP20 family protein
MNELFQRFFGGNGSRLPKAAEFVPALDVIENKDDYAVKMEIPGIDAKDIEVKLEGDSLTVRGEKKAEKEEKGKNFHRIERSYGAFTRSVGFPLPVKAEGIKAVCKNGVLEVTVPKSEQAKTKEVRVEVKS